MNPIHLLGVAVLGSSLALCGGTVAPSATAADASNTIDSPAPGDALLRSDACDCAAPGPGVCTEASATDSSAPAPIPFGIYTQCDSTVVTSGSTVTGPGGIVTLTGGGGSLMLDVGPGVFAFAKGTLAFSPVTASTAVAAPGQAYGISDAPCATSTITSGALALEGQTLVVSLLGEGCQSPISGTLRCAAPAMPTGTVGPLGPCPSAGGGCPCGDAGLPAFPTGTYGQCTVSIPSFGGGSATLAGSPTGLAAAIGAVTGVSPASATLNFSADSDRTASIVPGQTWVLSVPGAFAPFVSMTVRIADGFLVVDGSTLFAFIGGTDSAGQVLETFHCTASK